MGPGRENIKKKGKITPFRGPKSGPHWDGKSSKKWSLHFSTVCVGEKCKTVKTRGQKNPGKTALFRETVKTPHFSTFPVFYIPG